MSRLEEHRRVWAQKPVLREIYRREFFSRIASEMIDGNVVEVGGGPGFFKEYHPDAISLDILPTKWLDLVSDAEVLPFRSKSVRNIVCTDVIHHLSDPLAFLVEVARVLTPNGRLVMVEPWSSRLSALVYTHFHREDYVLEWSPGQLAPPTKDPFEGNQAIPFVLFNRQWDEVARVAKGLRLVQIERFCLFAYLLSCGFQPTNFMPKRLYPAVARFESVTQRLWSSWGCLRALIVIERI